jgi:hypothetical protein
MSANPRWPVSLRSDQCEAPPGYGTPGGFTAAEWVVEPAEFFGHYLLRPAAEEQQRAYAGRRRSEIEAAWAADQANARLMAAAPRLLEVALSLIEWEPQGRGAAPELANLTALQDAARAAVLAAIDL